MSLPRSKAELELQISRLNVLQQPDAGSGSPPNDAAAADENTTLQAKVGLLLALRGVLPSTEKLQDMIQQIDTKKKSLLKVQSAAIEIERASHTPTPLTENIVASGASQTECGYDQVPGTRVELEMDISRLENILEAASRSKNLKVVGEAIAMEEARNRLQGYRKVLPSSDELRFKIHELDQAMEELGTSNFRKRLELLKEQATMEERLEHEEKMFRLFGGVVPVRDYDGIGEDGEEEKGGEGDEDNQEEDDSTVFVFEEQSDDDSSSPGDRR